MSWDARNSDALQALNSMLHDGKLPLESVVHEAEIHRVSMDVEAFRSTTLERRRGGVFATGWKERWIARLIVEDASSLAVVDEAGVGSFDFKGIDYEPQRGELTIRGHLPVRLVLSVSSLHVRVEDTGRVLAREPLRVLWPFYAIGSRS